MHKLFISFLLLYFCAPIQTMQRPCTQFLKNSASFSQEGFTAGTQIHTPNGIKPIEHIQKGDEVFSYDHFAQKYRRNIILKTHQGTIQAQ